MLRKSAMAEMRALDEPLSDAELDSLEGFLASDSVPQDCMDLEMLDGFLTAIVSGPESIQPSEWLPQVWSDGGRTANPAFADNEQAQRIMGLMLRHMVGIQRTLSESPTRFKPLLYMPDEKARNDKTPPEASAWCEGYMAGVKHRDERHLGDQAKIRRPGRWLPRARRKFVAGEMQVDLLRTEGERASPGAERHRGHAEHARIERDHCVDVRDRKYDVVEMVDGQH